MCLWVCYSRAARRKPLYFVLGGLLFASTVSAVDLTDNLGIGFDAINDTVTVRWIGNGIGVEGRLGVAASIATAASSVTVRPGAAVVIPFQFLKLPFVAVVALIWFAEQPDPWTWIGALVIFFSTYLIVRMEAGTTLADRPTQPRPGP